MVHIAIGFEEFRFFGVTDVKETISREDIFQSINTGIIVFDAEGTISHINRSAETLLHTDDVSCQGRNLSELFPALAKSLSTFSSTRSPQLSIQIDRPSQLVCDLIPIVRSDVFCGGICTVSELKNFEISARKSASYKALNQQLKTIIESSSDGLWVCDAKGSIITINKASEKLNGIKAEDVIGENIEALLEKQVFDHSVTSMVIETKERQTVMQYISKTQKMLLSTGTPALDEDGSIVMIVVNERDITELNNLRKEYEHSQRIKEKYKAELNELALLELRENTLVADSVPMRNILQMSLKLAHIGASNILILGESGTGKSMLSKLIHKNSNRHANPFVEINCAALPESLLEAELFGYEKGAFTGASNKGKIGLFEMAHQGTLFLDEIGDMPLPLQAKLLKYLDNQEIRRIGGTKSIHVECSVIAATNQNLQKLVKEKLFREDLYYRLNSFILKIPPLRERTGDIAGLIRFFLEKFNTKYQTDRKISSQTMQDMLHYSFPGNIRELRNIVENAVVLGDNDTVDDFVSIRIGDTPENVGRIPVALPQLSELDLTGQIKELEKTLLTRAKKQFSTTREMAKHLGISQPSVVRKLKEHGIS